MRLSSGEIRHLFWQLVVAVERQAAQILQWSWWRRGHQAWAAYHHGRRRAELLPPVAVEIAVAQIEPEPAGVEVVEAPTEGTSMAEVAETPAEGTLADTLARVWARLEPLLPAQRRAGRQIVHDRRHILEAIVYVMHTDCGWSALPSRFPPWKTVHDHYVTWRKTGIWAQIWAGIRLPGARPLDQLQL